MDNFMPQLYFTNAPWIPDYETYFYSKLSGLKTTNQENKGKEKSNVNCSPSKIDCANSMSLNQSST